MNSVRIPSGDCVIPTENNNVNIEPIKQNRTEQNSNLFEFDTYKL